jgi:hypothetical protein
VGDLVLDGIAELAQNWQYGRQGVRKTR